MYLLDTCINFNFYLLCLPSTAFTSWFGEIPLKTNRLGELVRGDGEAVKVDEKDDGDGQDERQRLRPGEERCHNAISQDTGHPYPVSFVTLPNPSKQGLAGQ